MAGKLTVVEGMALAEVIAANWEQIYNFQARPGDILIDTYPKSGKHIANSNFFFFNI